MKKIIIGSRGSDLALWQANFVKNELAKIGYESEIKIIVTQGDAIQHLSFDKLEGKGFFTKEIEKELLDKTIDLAVHSHKDLETTPPAGLIIAAVSDREDPSELMLIRKEAIDNNQLWSLKQNAIIGTSSARRKAIILANRPDLEIKDLRGNVPTRIDKLRNQQYDAILLAKAGVSRLKIALSEFEVVILDPTSFIPAPAQGVLGLQVREDDSEIISIVSKLNNKEIAEIISHERGVLQQMEGGCQLPLGVYAPSNEKLYVSYAKTKNLPAQTKIYNLTQETIASIVDDLKSW